MSANMLPPSLLYTSAHNFSLNNSKSGSMYLGEWRNQISKKINPSYFSLLNKKKIRTRFSSNFSNISYNQDRFTKPIFSRSLLSSFSDSADLSFSFVTENIKLTPMAFNQMISGMAPRSASQFTGNSKFATINVLEQQYYSPGYVFSTGKSSFGVAAVFVQQRFLDNSFSSFSLASSSSYQLYSDKAFMDTNRGTGYQVNFNQSMPANIDFSFNYQSEVNMNEFDTFGRSYSEPGDFDIPSQLTMRIGIPLLESNKISFSAERITYSNVKSTVNASYSQRFLNVFNNPISPDFELLDLVVYSVSFKQNISKKFSWIVDVTSRQQPPASTSIFNNILKEDTAPVSYRVGLTHSVAKGELNLFASFASKPILFGNTDFGRLSSTSLNRHIEGVLSWSLSF